MRLMFQLALRQGEGYVFLKEIARQERISEKYLSQIVMPLRARGLVLSSRGANGGYRLAKEPAAVTARDIVEALDPDFTNARPLRGAEMRDHLPGSVTRIVWQTMYGRVDDALASITLQSLLDAHRARAAALEYQI